MGKRLDSVRNVAQRGWEGQPRDKRGRWTDGGGGSIKNAVKKVAERIALPHTNTSNAKTNGEQLGRLLKDLRNQYPQFAAIVAEHAAAGNAVTDKILAGKNPSSAENKRFSASSKALNNITAEYELHRGELIIQNLEKTYKEPQPQTEHGMSKPEKMWSVEHEGIRYHGTGKLNSKHPIVKMIGNNAEESPLPKSLSRHTSDIYFSKQGNKDDEYWAKTYNMAIVSAATGGDSKVVYYNGAGGDRGVTIHEMGHNLATGKYSSPTPPENSSYVQAATKDGDHPSNYGRKSLGEDFAETARMYHTEPEILKKASPNRYQVMKKILEDENFGG